MPLTPDRMFASLRARKVELCVNGDVWIEHPVTDDWTGNAYGRRYVVLIMGTGLLEDDADSESISAYLKQRDSVYASLLKIRLRVEAT